ncbi:SnoaL-like domain [Actinoalloteichus fjordicus]|uniref:SnoaL-like domain n=2 Tax=Actinoalloteichus fjordicus TaxID=1612552 RepID=A0AAC9LDT8_9PSEU|nr:SnoaL-like domain [Actinoalloteichus fjordicus]
MISAFVAAMEAKDLSAVVDMIDRDVELTVALSFTGEPEPAARFVGDEQVLGYLTGVFTNMATIDFVDERVSVTADGATSFRQANGDFTTADGRPYRNAYVVRLDGHEGRLPRSRSTATRSPTARPSAIRPADARPRPGRHSVPRGPCAVPNRE